MRYDPDSHHRRTIRLKGYDYSQAGTYFVSICTQNRECLFGDIVDGEMALNDAGRMVKSVWGESAKRFPDTELDEFIALPSHIHGIVVIVGAPLVGAQSAGAEPAGAQSACVQTPEGRQKRAGTRPAPTRLGDVAAAFTSIATDRGRLCIPGF